MKKLLLFLLIISASVTLPAQAVYEKYFPNLSDPGDLFITWSPTDHTYFYTSVDNLGVVQLIHLDSTGNALQDWSYSGMNASSANIVISPIGIIYVSGAMLGPGVNYYILALNPDGTVFWSKTYATNSQMPYNQPKLKVLVNGNLLLVESVYGHLGYIETDPLGSIVKSEQFREDTTVENKTPGFAGDVYNDGTFIFTGKRGSDIALVHSDANGNIIWSTLLNSGNSYYHTKDVATCNDGSAIACGYQDGNPFVLKVDATGTMVWYNVYAEYSTTYYDVEVLNDSTFITCGTKGTGVIVSKFDMNGNEISSFVISNSFRNITATDFNLNPYGAIAVPIQLNAPWQTEQAGLFIMENGFTLGCSMTPLSLVSSTSASDPSVVAVPIFSTNEPITVSSITVTSTSVFGTTDDLCILLNNPEPVTPALHLALLNSPAASGTPVLFSLGEEQGSIEYVVTDALGQKVMQRSTDYNGTAMPIEGSQSLASGIYLLSVSKGELTCTEKFIVR